MTLDDLRGLAERLSSDANSVTAEELADARKAAQKLLDPFKKKKNDGVALLSDEVEQIEAIAAAHKAIRDEQTSRAAAEAEVNAKGASLLDDLDGDDADDKPAEGDGDADTPSAEVIELPQAAEGEQPVAVAASAAQVKLIADTVAASVAAAFAAREKLASPGKPEGEEKPQGRTARNIGNASATNALPATDSVRHRVHAAGSDGAREHGQEIPSSADLGSLMANRLRGHITRGGNGERVYVASMQSTYPSSRILRAGLDADAIDNFSKIQAVTSPTALVAAGGLCAPLENDYSVEVVGSADRPVKAALAQFQVERGGIQYRPAADAAAAVYGAGVWAMADDAANPIGSKGCYVVDCPDPQSAVVEAIYLCLEFSNITARFDPEVTASNVQLGSIAHARLAENRLLMKLGAGSKILSAPKVVGATRDILANLDKAIAYWRNRHRVTEAVQLTFILPGWVKSLMRADIARQMAAGDWVQALTLADSMIAGWFAARAVSPVWHLDGPVGVDEVQTVTISGGPTGGAFKLTYNGQTTADIAYNATAAQVRSALDALNNLRAEDITVTGSAGGPYTITFGGGVVDGTNVSQITATNTFTGGTSPSVATATTTGGGGAITINGVSVNSQMYPEAPAGGVLPGFPDTIDSLLFPSGSWLFLDGGNLDLGLVRDSALNDRNRYRQFMETFEGAAFRGIESLRLVMSVQPTGGTAGTVDTSGITD